MLKFTAGTNLEDIIGALTDLEATAVPFATVVALSRTASAASREVKIELPARFTLRRDWVAKGVRVKPATLSDPVALVYTKDWFMQQQEEGGERHPLHATSLYIPTLAVREGETFAGDVKKALRPKVLLAASEKAAGRSKRRYGGKRMGKNYAKPLAFIATVSGKRGLYIRRFENQRLPLVMLYRVQDSAKIPPRWGFQETTQRISAKQLRRQFIDALDEALRKRKRGAVHSEYVSYLKEHPNGFSNATGGSESDALSGGMLSAMTR